MTTDIEFAPGVRPRSCDDRRRRGGRVGELLAREHRRDGRDRA